VKILKEYTQIEFWDIEENENYKELINKVVLKCFEEENLLKTNLYLNIILTNPETIRETNKKYRNIDKETDVLSFPMFEKNELDEIIKSSNEKENNQEKSEIMEDVLGDIMISIYRVIEQAKEYGHSVERELAYMVVHGFYHVMGYDHIEEDDKKIMRPKEENVLNKLNITR
jgi:probable rRNA maturation factor